LFAWLPGVAMVSPFCGLAASYLTKVAQESAARGQAVMRRFGPHGAMHVTLF